MSNKLSLNIVETKKQTQQIDLC